MYGTCSGGSRKPSWPTSQSGCVSLCDEVTQSAFSAEDEYLRFGKHRGQKVMLRFNLYSKLVYRVHGRINIPPKSFLGALYHRDHIAERRSTNNRQIDVACSVEFTPRGGAEHERRMNAVGEWHQRFTQNVHESRGLREQPSQLGKDRRVLVCLEVHLLAPDLAAYQASSGQLFQLALNRADCATSVPHQLAQVVRFVGVAEQPPEHASTGAAKKQHRGIYSKAGCSQDGDKRIQNGYARSTVPC